MSSPSKVKKLKRNHSKLWGHKHKHRKTGQGLFMTTDKYKISVNQNTSIPIKKLKVIKSFGSFSYVSANYKQNNKSTCSLILLDEQSNKFYCNKKIQYVARAHNNKLIMDDSPTVMDSDYIVDGIETSFASSSIKDIKHSITTHIQQYNTAKAQLITEEHEENEENDDEYSVPILPQNDTVDHNDYTIEAKCDDVLKWKNNLNQISLKTPTTDWILTQIKIFERNGTMTKKTFHDIDNIINKMLGNQKKKDNNMRLSFVFPKNTDKKNQNSDHEMENRTKKSKKCNSKKWICICGASFGNFKGMIIHNALKRRFGDALHLNSKYFCSFWDSGNCSTEYHWFPTLESKNHHELYWHHNEIKKNQYLPNFEKECGGCGTTQTKWKVSRNGLLMGIRCDSCKFAYWVKKKYKKKRNELSEAESSLIRIQFKTQKEMQQEYRGLQGEAPDKSTQIQSTPTSTESPSKGMSTLSIAHSNNEQNHNDKNELNTESDTKLLCQVCKILFNINTYFDNEHDLKSHLSALHKK